MPPASGAPVETEVVRVEETGGGRFQLSVRAGGATFLADEPIAQACTSMTLRLYAARKGWALARVKVRVGHGRASLYASDAVDREISLEGDLDEARRARLLDIANRRPVHVTLEKGSEVRAVLISGSDRSDDTAAVEGSEHMRDINEAVRA